MARQFTWSPPDGSDPLILTDAAAGFRVLAEGTRGLDAPPYRFTTSTYAGLPGQPLDALEADAREMALGMQIERATEDEFRAAWRRLAHAMRPRAGDGLLTVTDEAGRARSITCRYTGGLEGDGSAAWGLGGRAVVKLTAFDDPWWYGEERSVTAALAAGGSFFPFPPLRLAPSTVQGRFTVDLSDTDAETYARWTVLGPGSGLVLANETTGQSTAVTATLGAGQSIVIDTWPGEQSVHRGDLEEDDPGWNLFGALAGDPALWPLVDGVNVITCSLTGATGDSTITGVYAPRYAGI